MAGIACLSFTSFPRVRVMLALTLFFYPFYLFTKDLLIILLTSIKKCAITSKVLVEGGKLID